MIESILEQQRPQLEVRNVSVTFGTQQVLRNIQLSIPAGQTLVVLGESGCVDEDADWTGGADSGRGLV
jgi:phospholipid/cholesterol/gamma-HCH transport system ATP-binding protein